MAIYNRNSIVSSKIPSAAGVRSKAMNKALSMGEPATNSGTFNAPSSAYERNVRPNAAGGTSSGFGKQMGYGAVAASGEDPRAAATTPVTTSTAPAPQSRDQRLQAQIDRLMGAGRDEYKLKLDTEAAQAIDAANARAGLGGMGLGGAAAALDSGTRLNAATEKALAMNQYDTNALNTTLAADQAARANKMEDLTSRIYVNQQEVADQIDYNGDGMIGTEQDQDTLNRDEVRKNSSYDDAWGVDSTGGTVDEPFTSNSRKSLEDQGFEFRKYKNNWNGESVYVDQDGQYWIFYG